MVAKIQERLAAAEADLVRIDAALARYGDMPCSRDRQDGQA